MHYSFALLFFCITPCDTFMYSMHGVVYDTIYAVIFLNINHHLQNYVLFVFRPNFLTLKVMFYYVFIPSQLIFCIFC